MYKQTSARPFCGSYSRSYVSGMYKAAAAAATTRMGSRKAVVLWKNKLHQD